jgi:spore germination protein GerM
MVFILAFTPAAAEKEPEAVYNLFVSYFESENISAPEDVRVLGVKINDDHLILNVSGEIANYGGNANEQNLIAELLHTAASIDGITYFTLLTEGELTTLPEGRTVENLSTALCHQKTSCTYIVVEPL